MTESVIIDEPEPEMAALLDGDDLVVGLEELVFLTVLEIAGHVEMVHEHQERTHLQLQSVRQALTHHSVHHFSDQRFEHQRSEFHPK